eukprot:scaffold424533_cov42-Prasinocladus_malaysianus.AAC.1
MIWMLGYEGDLKMQIASLRIEYDEQFEQQQKQGSFAKTQRGRKAVYLCAMHTLIPPLSTAGKALLLLHLLRMHAISS